MEKKYANQLVVIGVHSPKFENEKDSESIRKAILRYEISHPVINDADRKLWQKYQVYSWPTLFLIDPEGYAVGRYQHERAYDVFDRAIGELVKIHREKKTLNERPMQFELARFQEKGDSPLFFPGKVLADAAGKRLFIADSTHHRIVITDLEGNKIAIAGHGQPGRSDGRFADAGFADPQGMALRGETLYVADRKNNLIRALDLQSQTVTTVAGTGEQGLDRRRSGPALQIGLNSPWDLLIVGQTMYIAMAGHHQIWAMDLASNRLYPFAGTGDEELVDGPRGRSCFAQPSGLATNGRSLFIADSEVSAIRAIDFTGRGDVRTLVGQGLFDFGDVDGVGRKVRLQHALGVVHHDGLLYLTDTYNNKIKVLDPVKRTCQSLVGDTGGWLTGSLFNEPAGLSYADGKLYVADTNAHRIRVVDIKKKSVTTLKLKGVEAPAANVAGR